MGYPAATFISTAPSTLRVGVMPESNARMSLKAETAWSHKGVTATAVLLSLLLLLSAFLYYTVGPSQAAVPRSLTLYAVADSYIHQGTADTNYGRNPDLNVGFYPPGGGEFSSRYYGLVKFDLSEIPNDATITTARLTLYLKSGGGTKIIFQRVTSDWEESDVTWNNKPTWPSLPSFRFTPLTMDVGATPGYYSVNVTSYVKGWVKGDYPNHGLVIRPTSEETISRCTFQSRERTEDQSAKVVPRLEIEYLYPEPITVEEEPPPPRPVDNTPPTVEVDVSPGREVPLGSIANLTVIAHDDVGLDKLYLFRDGRRVVVKEALNKEGGDPRLVIAYSYGCLNERDTSFFAQAFDMAGNVAAETVVVRHRDIAVLKILDIVPVTQYGPNLIAGRQATFKIDYTLASTMPKEVDFLIKLPKRQGYWDTTLNVWREDPNYYILLNRVTLSPTQGSTPASVYLFENKVGQTGEFLPTPKYKGPEYEVQVDVDPLHRLAWDEEESTLSMTKRFRCDRKAATRGQRIKLVLFENTRGKKGKFRFTHEQIQNVLRTLIAPRIKPYELYLSGIFGGRFLVNPDNHRSIVKYGGKIGWWDADTLGEEAADEGYNRVVAICPPGAIGAYHDGSIGVVTYRCHGKYDQSYYTAFVDYDYALDEGRDEYFPLVAHELSHTYRFDNDIYNGHYIAVDHDYAYFDEINGGIVKLGKKEELLDINFGSEVVKGKDLEEINLPTYVSGRDIMDKLDKNQLAEYWVLASYETVRDHLRGGTDPPEGLVISLVIYKNGKVVGRPFQKIYNHSFRYPETEEEGNFFFVLLDKKGQVLRKYPYNIFFEYFTEPGGIKPADAVALVTIVEWIDGLGEIKLEDEDGKVWFSRKVTAYAPVIEVLSPRKGGVLRLDSANQIAWSGKDADGDTLWYSVLVRKKEAAVWKSLANRIKKTSISFTPTEEFTKGDYEFQIKATDGINTAVVYINVSMAKGGKLWAYWWLMALLIGTLVAITAVTVYLAKRKTRAQVTE